ncbi:MAG: helix-turn-helix domain-containing protein [Pseudomonadota bacterium]
MGDDRDELQDRGAHLGADASAAMSTAEASQAELEEIRFAEPSDGYFGEDSATLGDRVSAARQAAGLTQAGLASRLGVGAKVVSAWENDRSEPRANRLAMLAGLLNVSVTWLLTGRGDGVDPPETPVAISESLRPFRYAFCVADLDEARRFYGDILGCRLSAAADGRQDFDLFGHPLSAFAAPRDQIASPSLIDPEGVPVPHFGVLLDWDDWRALIERIRQEGLSFVLDPTIRFVGAPGEQGAFAIADPSGNTLAFKAFRDPENAFG